MRLALTPMASKRHILNSRAAKRRAFSMLELMIVIGIIALISSITLGTFRSVANSNRKTTCQSNMAQIYGALRLYAQDYNGAYPLLNTLGTTFDPTPSDSTDPWNSTKPGAGIGLWALYSYGNPTTAYGSAPTYTPSAVFPGSQERVGESFPILTEAPKTGYLRSTQYFHCPNDDFTYFNGQATLPTTQLRDENTGGGAAYFNPAYLSYQSPPSGVPQGLVDDVTKTPVYSSFRMDANSSGSTDVALSQTRQLAFYTTASGTPVANFTKRPRDITVIMWCRFHRKLNKDGTATVTTDPNNYDNVLFSDGSVQWVQSYQPVSNTSGSSGTCGRGWDRVPNQLQYTLSTNPLNLICPTP